MRKVPGVDEGHEVVVIVVVMGPRGLGKVVAEELAGREMRRDPRRRVEGVGVGVPDELRVVAREVLMAGRLTQDGRGMLLLFPEEDVELAGEVHGGEARPVGGPGDAPDLPRDAGARHRLRRRRRALLRRRRRRWRSITRPRKAEKGLVELRAGVVAHAHVVVGGPFNVLLGEVRLFDQGGRPSRSSRREIPGPEGAVVAAGEQAVPDLGVGRQSEGRVVVRPRESAQLRAAQGVEDVHALLPGDFRVPRLVRLVRRADDQAVVAAPGDGMELAHHLARRRHPP
mmetsp:Transcript_23591/g.75731  ORF Transcript_23591/g.75731 Transcript_23591/m.75731 type:complete len:284 (-) Transcript_23591:2557-3408(-)